MYGFRNDKTINSFQDNNSNDEIIKSDEYISSSGQVYSIGDDNVVFYKNNPDEVRINGKYYDEKGKDRGKDYRDELDIKFYNNINRKGSAGYIITNKSDKVLSIIAKEYTYNKSAKINTKEYYESFNTVDSICVLALGINETTYIYLDNYVNENEENFFVVNAYEEKEFISSSKNITFEKFEHKFDTNFRVGAEATVNSPIDGYYACALLFRDNKLVGGYRVYLVGSNPITKNFTVQENNNNYGLNYYISGDEDLTHDNFVIAINAYNKIN